MRRLLRSSLLSFAAAGQRRRPGRGGRALSGTLKTINDRGTILIGYRDSALPFSFLNKAGQPVGFRWICATASPRTWHAL